MLKENRNKYIVVVLIGLTLGMALSAGGFLTYTFFNPRTVADATEPEHALPPVKDNISALPAAIPDIVDNVGKAVVYIETTVESSGSQGNPFFDDPFFKFFFRENPAQPTPRVSKGLGSGFLINPEGYIITNEHVISGATDISVTVLGFEKPFKAAVVGKDFDLDLAVLKIGSSQKLPYIDIGDSDAMRVGEWVIAIGNPHQLDHTVTVGVVSAKGRPISIPDQSSGRTRLYKNLIQTDAAINPGNSGGPLISLKGEVIGINTAVSAQAQGIGFAIPINTAKEVLDDLIKNGSVSRPYIGVIIQDVTKDFADYYGLKEQKGALIGDVYPDSPAEKAGLLRGDVILSINDTQIESSNDVSDLISKTKINDKLMMTIFRGGNTQFISITIGKKPQ